MSSWQTKPGNNAKGWNDPPMFIYGPNANLQSTRRNVLNKRVAFPVDENPGYSTQYASQQNYYQSHNPYSNQSVPHPGYSGYHYHNEPTTLMEAAAPQTPQNFHLLPPSTYPEPPSYHGPVVVPTMPVSYSNHAYEQSQYHVTSTVQPKAPYRPGVAKDPMSELPVAAIMDDSDLQIPNFADDEQMYHYCVTRLQRALNECRTTTEERLINEMQKKLNVFSEMWKSGKISYVVKSTMCKLATAIHRRKYSIANELHLVLMMDHISEVSKWLVGIKKLVQEVEKAPQHPTSPSVSCSYDNPSGISQDLNHQPLTTFETVVPASIVNTSSIHPPYADDMTANSISLQPTVNNATTVNNFYPPNADVITTSNHFYDDFAFNTPLTYDHFHIKNTNSVQRVTDDLMGLNITQVASYTEETCDPSIDQHNPRLSCSPPTFDPMKIDQCFNDHGELLLKFVGDDDRDDDQNNNKAKGDKSLVGHCIGSVHEDLKPVEDDDAPNHRDNLPNSSDLGLAESQKDDEFPCQPIKGDFNLSDDVAPVFEEIDLMSDRGVESSTNNEVNGY